MRLILASASPRRAELLAAAGFRFEVLVADVDERVHPNETPADYVRRLAQEKSRAAQARLDGSTSEAVVLGADTSVVIDDRILGKPGDAAESERMLRLLSGRSHLVLTGVSVRLGQVERGCVEETQVFFRPLTNHEVDWYVKSGEGADKAGAYAIQGLASRFIPRIEGSYSNVVGLPVARVAEVLGALTSW